MADTGDCMQPGKVDIQVTDCPVEKVVVYQDRAEVYRLISTRLKKGENEVKIKNLSRWLDEDSIRVESRGKATILEVTYHDVLVNIDDDESRVQKSKQDRIEADIKCLENRIEELNLEKKRYEKQLKILDSFSDAVTKSGTTTTEQINNQVVVKRFDKEQLTTMSSFLHLFGVEQTALDDCILKANRSIDKNLKEIETQNDNLRKLGQQTHTSCLPQVRECSILLDCDEEGVIDLVFSYVVSQASWSPRYDIRVFTADTRLKIMYYGMVQQSTGEDWYDTKIFLSTAMPSIGGTVPVLGTCTLSIRSKHVTKTTSSPGRIADGSSRKAKRGLSILASPRRGDPQEEKGYETNPESDDESYKTQEFSLMPTSPCKERDMLFSVAKVKESYMSTTFEIPRPATVPCDNSGHKVAVGIIDLTPSFDYETVPQLSPHAFLKANIKNTSQYAFLPGPCNVFLNNNFVAKSELDSVSPGEEFHCSLGVDPAIKITYKPIKKFVEKGGIITKVTTTTYQQDIEVKNNHLENIKITVKDNIPRSSTDKIKVNLIEPALSKNSEKKDKNMTMKMNKQNNIEWHLELASSELKEVNIKYSVDVPSGEETNSQVVFSSNKH